MNMLPTVQGTPSVGGSTVATKTPAIVLPAGILRGERALIFLSFNQTAGNKAAPIIWPAGVNVPTNDLGDCTASAFFIAFRVCDGSEGGATISPLLSISDTYSYVCYRISEAGLITVAVHVVDSVGSTSPDPPDLAPSGGAKDYLSFAATGWDNGITALSAYPANYSANAAKYDTNDVAGASITGVAVGTRQLNAASEDPGPFTLSAVEQFSVTTVLVAPPALKKLDRESFGSVETEGGLLLLTE